MLALAIVVTLLVTAVIVAVFLLVLWVAERWGTGWGVLLLAALLLPIGGLFVHRSRRVCERHWAEATTLMDTLRIVRSICDLPGRRP